MTRPYACLAVLPAAAMVAVSIYSGGRLVPDTGSYASGGSAWSSPIAALAGRLGGLELVRLVALLAAIASLYVLFRSSSGWTFPTIVAVLLLPVGAAYLCAGADALGVLAVVVVLRRSRHAVTRFLPLVCAAHLAAGLGLAASLAARRTMKLPLPAGLLAAGICELLFLRGLGLLGGSSEPTQLQWRYTLPGLFAVLACTSGAAAVSEASGRDGRAIRTRR
jgi:hypothetical protein